MDSCGTSLETSGTTSLDHPGLPPDAGDQPSRPSIRLSEARMEELSSRGFTHQIKKDLVGHIQTICQSLKSSFKVFELGIYVLENYLLRKMVNLSQSLLLGVMAVFIAYKFESGYPEKIFELDSVEAYCSGQYSQKEIRLMEVDILQTLGWKMVFYSPSERTTELAHNFWSAEISTRSDSFPKELYHYFYNLIQTALEKPKLQGISYFGISVAVLIVAFEFISTELKLKCLKWFFQNQNPHSTDWEEIDRARVSLIRHFLPDIQKKDHVIRLNRSLEESLQISIEALSNDTLPQSSLAGLKNEAGSISPSERVPGSSPPQQSLKQEKRTPFVELSVVEIKGTHRTKLRISKISNSSKQNKKKLQDKIKLEKRLSE